jgi:hypothetical protein
MLSQGNMNLSNTYQPIVPCQNGHPEDGDEDMEDNDYDQDDEEFTNQLDDDDHILEGGDPVSIHPTSAPVEVKSSLMRHDGPRKACSTIATWLRQDYQDVIERIRREITKNSSNRPSCYERGQFYDQPHLPIFAASRCAQLDPIMFYQPTYFIWLPHLFVKIPCPACKSAGRKRNDGQPSMLALHSWPHMPRRVVDINSCIFIIGRRYRCGHRDCGHTYQSWSRAILDIIPKSLSSHFPHHLTFCNGLTDQLVAVLQSSFQRGLGPAPFAEMIQTFHIRRYEQLHIQYLEMVNLCTPFTTTGLLSLHKPFGKWDDISGYAGFVPSHSYFKGFYVSLLERHAPEIDQYMAMLPARILNIDHSFKVCIQAAVPIFFFPNK